MTLQRAAPGHMAASSHPLHVGIIAGEASGDNIAAALIQAIRKQVPDAVFEGIAGPRMTAAGCYSLYPMERLSVMGLAEVVQHLPGLVSMRRDLARHFLASPPDIFIGVDAPDFNLALERKLKKAGIRTKGLLMMGLPGESEESVRKSREYVFSLPIDDFNLAKFTPFPGTPLYEHIEELGEFDEDWEKEEAVDYADYLDSLLALDE